MQQKDLFTEAKISYNLISFHSFWECSVGAAEGQYLLRIVQYYSGPSVDCSVPLDMQQMERQFVRECFLFYFEK